MRGNKLIPLLRRGDGSTLSLDFTAMSGLDSRFTFSRASTATFINSSGLVESAANGVARFDHDPATLAPKGLLIEGSSTNVLAGFTATGVWSRQNIDGSGTAGALANGQTGPDGVSNTAARIATAATTTMTNMFVSRATNAAGNTRTFSVWLRGVAANTTASIAINGSNAPTGVASSQAGHAVTLTTSTSGNNLFGLVTGLSTTAWTRVSISRTDTQSSADAYRICPGDHNGTINSGLSLDVYVPQAESGIGMTSTIPTGSGTVQRAADLCSISGSAFASFYGAPTGWTVAVRAIPQSRAAGQFPTFLAVRSAADSGVRIYYYNDGPYNTAYRFGTASTQADIFGPNSLTYGVSRWFGASVTSGAQIASSAGVQVGSTQTLAVPMDQTVMGIGNDAAASPSNHARVHIQTIKFWPRAFSVAELNAVTT